MKICPQIKTAAAAGACLFTLFMGISDAQAFSQTFPRALKLGMNGEDVREMQRVLNTDPVTRVQDSGPGSPGQETAYFGALTRAAVIRFQEKYSQQILTPNGLSSGTGFAGSYTLDILVQLKDLMAGSQTFVPQGTVVATNPTPSTSSTPNSPVTPSFNPNLKNLDKFLTTVEKVASKQGVNPETIINIKSQITKDAATTTDLRATFLKLVEENNKPKQSAGTDSFFEKIVAGASSRIGKLFEPKQVVAQTGTPFGGALLYTYFCTCSFTWLIFVEPLPPTFAVLLTYTPFSQGYLSYNIPYTAWLLGKYSSGGQCQIYYGYGCLSIPSEGMITPMVGSSAI